MTSVLSYITTFNIKDPDYFIEVVQGLDSVFATHKANQK